MATFKPPRAFRMLAVHGINALKPRIVNGKFVSPLVSKRIAAVVRKRAIIEGTFGSFNELWGGWKEEWDTPHKMFVIKPNKGHKNERTRHARAEKITKAMEGMPERLAKYKQEAMDRKPKKDIAYIFKRAAELVTGRRKT